MSHLLHFLILLMDENLFRDPFLSPHTMTACDDCLAERASVLVKIRRPAHSGTSRARPRLPPAGWVRPSVRPAAGPSQLSQLQSVSQLSGSCQAPVAWLAHTHTRSWRNPLPGPGTVTWLSRDPCRPPPGTWQRDGPGRPVCLHHSLAPCDQRSDAWCCLWEGPGHGATRHNQEQR